MNQAVGLHLIVLGLTHNRGRVFLGMDTGGSSTRTGSWATS